MRRHVFIYGLLGGALIALLNLVEYRFVIVQHSMQIYGGIIAALFATLGIWLGVTLTRRRETASMATTGATDSALAPFGGFATSVASAVPAVSTDIAPMVDRAEQREALGITKRELEILELMAAGLSNREIAERIFVSENTVKTHSSRLFEKLSARRRTQAVQIGKARGLLP